MWLKLIFAFLLIGNGVYAAAEEKKWIWGDAKQRDEVQRVAGRQAKEYLGRVPLERYEIYENERPGRPHDFRPPVDYQRPYEGLGGPGGHYGGAGGHYGGAGILAGPNHQGPITEIDKCKCTEKFNCPSTAIAYGQCDVGKKYCCQGTVGPIPSKPIHSIENGVLSGPGGPVDYRPQQNYANRPGLGPINGPRPNPYEQGPYYGNQGSYGNPGAYYGNQGQYGAQHPGVLVGPGGPTGIVGRPQPPNPGVLVGPGGPTGIIGRPPHHNSGVLVGPGGPTGVIGRPENPLGEFANTLGNILGTLGGYQGAYNRPYNNFGIGRSNTADDTKNNDKSE